jgi:hypothetical protein
MSTFSRRSFVRSAGLATLFAPFIDFLEPRPAQAQSTKTYKNLLIFFTPGTAPASWHPAGSTDSNIVWSPMTQKLEPLKANLILASNLSSFGSAGAHGAPGGLTGKGYGEPTHQSLDQYISDKLPQMPIRNIILGGIGAEQQTTFFRAGQALMPLYSVSAAHQALFGGFTPTPGGGEPEPGPVEPTDQTRRRKSSLVVLKEEIAQLRDRLGTSERQKLDLHADSIHQLEIAMEANQGGGGGGGGPIGECAVPGAPTAGSEALLNSVKHLDLAIQALACGRTRVASVAFGHHQRTDILLPGVGSGDWHNTFMHSEAAPFPTLIKLESWLCEQFVATAEKLKAIPLIDGSGSLFDQTLMLWARDMGDGPGHGGDDMRFVLASGANNYLRFSPNGRWINGNNQHHQSVLASVVEAMGVTDLNSFGDPAHPRTPLTGLAA